MGCEKLLFSKLSRTRRQPVKTNDLAYVDKALIIQLYQNAVGSGFIERTTTAETSFWQVFARFPKIDHAERLSMCYAPQLSSPDGPKPLRPLQRARCWRAGIGRSFR